MVKAAYFLFSSKTNVKPRAFTVNICEKWKQSALWSGGLLLKGSGEMVIISLVVRRMAVNNNICLDLMMTVVKSHGIL